MLQVKVCDLVEISHHDAVTTRKAQETVCDILNMSYF